MNDSPQPPSPETNDILANYAAPFAWWGAHWNAPQPLSVVQLIRARTFDAHSLALIWLMMERGASVIVAAEPQESGKSTVLHALLDFISTARRRVYVRGSYETFEFLDLLPPEQAYVLCNELSDHLDVYMWGRKARRLLLTLEKGYPLAATLHADSPEETIALLKHGLGLTDTQLARLDLVVVLRVALRRDLTGGRFLANDAIVRRAASVNLVRLEGQATDGDVAGKTEPPELTAYPLVVWSERAGRFDHYDSDPDTLAALLERTGLSAADLANEIGDRAAYLTELAERGIVKYDDVQQAIADYHDEP